jgi:hypothetical protein
LHKALHSAFRRRDTSVEVRIRGGKVLHARILPHLRGREEAVQAPGCGPLLDDQAKCPYSSITNMNRINGMVSAMDNPEALVLVMVGLLILTCVISILNMHITNISNYLARHMFEVLPL